MTKKIRRFWAKGVWNIFQNGEFIGQVYKVHNGWTFRGSHHVYEDLPTAVQMM